jgi:hypothetical protein
MEMSTRIKIVIAVMASLGAIASGFGAAESQAGTYPKASTYHGVSESTTPVDMSFSPKVGANNNQG